MKSRRLLATLLTSTNDAFSADRLIDLLWPEKEPRTARSNLQVNIHRLRRLLGEDRIAHTAAGYRLVVNDGELDADQFEALMSEGAHYEALARWRGEAYDGIEELDPVREEAARLSELRLVALEARIEQDLDHGRSAAVIPELSWLVSRHPLRERFRGLLMLALYRSGRVPEALEVYRQARHQLVDELGLEPSRKLRSLEQAILAEDPSLDTPTVSTTAPAVPAELPAETGTFTGRQEDLERIGTLVAREESVGVPVVAITGPGGIGKSAVAMHAARRVAEDFPDGQLYVNLQGSTPGLSPLRPEDVLGRLLRSLGSTDLATPHDVDEAAGRLRTLTAGRKLLFVLDDAVDEAQVRPLLPGGSDSAVLITSRQMFTYLDGAVQYRLGALAGDEATSLLARVVGKERLAVEPAAATELARLCDNLPLALCIAGAKLASRPNWPVRALVDRMLDEQRRLDELESRDRAVRASFAASYDDLDAEPARLFRLLGLLDGPDISVTVAAALVERSEPAAEALLERLLDSQLAESFEPGRYRLHDLLRLFAREQTRVLDSESERDAAVRRALHCYLATGLNAERIQNPTSWRSRFVPQPLTHPGVALADDAEIGSWLTAEVNNLVAAGRQATRLERDGPALSAAFAGVLFAPLNTRGRWYELRTLIEIALTGVQGQQLPDCEALMRNDLGWILALLGDESEALPHLEPALAHWRQTGDRVGEAHTLRVMGRALSQQRRDEEALECVRLALAAFEELGNEVGQIDTYLALGLLFARLDNLDEAIAAHLTGIALAERHGQRWHAGVLVGNLGELQRRSGHYQESVAAFERALDFDRSTGNADTYFEAEHLWGLGTTLHALGNDDAARSCWDRSAVILRDLRLIDAAEYQTLTAAPVPETPPVIARQL
ncbi:MAG TPA: BTAD domain-containing putative transcriptional regulator [Jiangellaceae bacterium]|nr:BTAD domain-containing putative transcriptional regulator [Jiangellaceae bacterium]